MITEKFILASSEIEYAGILVETLVQWQQPSRKGFQYVFFQYNNGEMVTRFKLKFK